MPWAGGTHCHPKSSPPQEERPSGWGPLTSPHRIPGRHLVARAGDRSEAQKGRVGDPCAPSLTLLPQASERSAWDRGPSQERLGAGGTRAGPAARPRRRQEHQPALTSALWPGGPLPGWPQASTDTAGRAGGGAGRGRGRPAPPHPPSEGLPGVGPRFGPSVPAASAIHSLAKDASGESGGRARGRAGVTTLSGLGREGPGRGPDAAVTTLPGPAHSPRPPPPGCAAPAPAPSLSPRTLFRPPSTLRPPRLYDGGRQADATSPEASMTVEGRAPQHASAVTAPAR